MASVAASVVITTKDRKDSLRVALESAVKQSVPIEVLVIDDGSSDGTAEMVQTDFPSVRLVHFDRSAGLIVRRTQAASLAKGEIIFSIDDDAAFSTPEVVRQTLAEFCHPRVAAVAIPFINVNQDNIVRQRAPDAKDTYLTDQYIGTAHALRREVFVGLGGYRAHLFHQGEELDYCIRALDAGYVVRLGNADPIHHYESPRRSFKRMDIYGKRNHILFVWHNVPWRYFPMRLVILTAAGAQHGLKTGRPLNSLWGLVRGYGGMLRFFHHRKPVRSATFRLSRRLSKRKMPLSEVEPLLPPMTT
ncbi:MAG: glycosyltransferase [Phycisphaerales bacterium]|nr:glycosyltransferase [Phycisphaerales bacterium]